MRNNSTNGAEDEGCLDRLLHQVDHLRRLKNRKKQNIANLQYEARLRPQMLQEKSRLKHELERDFGSMGTSYNAALARIQTMQEYFSYKRRSGEEIQMKSEEHVQTLKQQGMNRVGILDNFLSDMYSSLQPIIDSITSKGDSFENTKERSGVFGGASPQEMSDQQEFNHQLEVDLGQKMKSMKKIQEIKGAGLKEMQHILTSDVVTQQNVYESLLMEEQEVASIFENEKAQMEDERFQHHVGGQQMEDDRFQQHGGGQQMEDERFQHHVGGQQMEDERFQQHGGGQQSASGQSVQMRQPSTITNKPSETRVMMEY